MKLTREKFESELDLVMKQSEQIGLVAIEVSSGNLHRRVGGYPGNDHRMPVCCEVMRTAMRSDDIVVSEPPKGKGAALVIRYHLPKGERG